MSRTSVLSMRARGSVDTQAPVRGYFLWVGGALLVLLFAANSLLPAAPPSRLIVFGFYASADPDHLRAEGTGSSCHRYQPARLPAYAPGQGDCRGPLAAAQLDDKTPHPCSLDVPLVDLGGRVRECLAGADRTSDCPKHFGTRRLRRPQCAGCERLVTMSVASENFVGERCDCGRSCGMAKGGSAQRAISSTDLWGKYSARRGPPGGPTAKARSQTPTKPLIFWRSLGKCISRATTRGWLHKHPYSRSLKLKAVFQQSQTLWTAELWNLSSHAVPHYRVPCPPGTPDRASSAGPLHRLLGLNADEIAPPMVPTDAMISTETKKA